MAALPSSLALTSVGVGAEILSADHRNNYAAVQTAVNALITALSSGVSGQVLSATGASSVAWAAGTTTYRKTTSKTVNTTVAETDLLNSEITLAANDLSTNKVAKFSAHGDWKQNSGGSTVFPRFKLKLGGTTLIDTGATTANVVFNSATRWMWSIDAKIAETGATNSQSVWFELKLGFFGAGTAILTPAFTTGQGLWTQGTPNNEWTETAFGWNSATVDGTASAALVLSVILPSASASCEIVLKDALVEVV